MARIARRKNAIDSRSAAFRLRRRMKSVVASTMVLFPCPFPGEDKGLRKQVDKDRPDANAARTIGGASQVSEG